MHSVTCFITRCLKVNFGQVLINMQQLTADQPSVCDCQSHPKDFQARPSWIASISKPEMAKSQRSAWILKFGASVRFVFYSSFSSPSCCPSLMLLCVFVCLSPPLQHISSRRHKDRAAGKPAKPKFSPYNPSQRHQGLHSVSTPPRFTVFDSPEAPLSSSRDRLSVVWAEESSVWNV